MIQTLPPELVYNVFLHCLPPSVGQLLPPSDACISHPISLSHVCRSWRSLALSCGELWSFLSIRFTTGVDQRKRKTLVDIFDTWLSRTNGSPINFTIECFLWEGDGVEDHRLAEYLIATMLSQQSRWKDVRFAWSGVKFSSNLPGLEISNVPILTSLSLNVGLIIPTSIDVARSPYLKSLNLSGNFGLSSMEEPLLLVTEGKFHLRSDQGFTWSRTVQTCLDFLKRVPRLQKFEGEFIHENTDSVRRTRDYRLSLPSIRALKLEHGDACATVLDSLLLPCLEALYYANSAKERILLDFIDRSEPPLTFLSVHGSCASEDEMVQVLRLLPYLRDLRYSGAYVSERFFHELTVETRTSEDGTLKIAHIISPALEVLEFHDLEPLDSARQCAEALKNMLKSRAMVRKAFERIWVNLDVCHSVGVDIWSIDNYTNALEFCFEGGDGEVVVGDPAHVHSGAFFPARIWYANTFVFPR